MKKEISKTNFRMWKSGKKWLYASSALLVIAGVAGKTQSVVHADTTSYYVPTLTLSNALTTGIAQDNYEQAKTAQAKVNTDLKALTTAQTTLNGKMDALKAAVDNSDLAKSDAKAYADKVTTAQSDVDSAQATFDKAYQTYLTDAKTYNRLLSSYTPDGTQAESIDTNSLAKVFADDDANVDSTQKSNQKIADNNVKTMGNYLKVAKAAHAVNTANSQLTSDKTTLDDLFTQLQKTVDNTNLAESDNAGYKSAFSDLQSKIDTAQASYKTDIDTYLSAAKAYNDTITDSSYDGMTAKALDVDSLTKALEKALDGIDPAQAANDKAAATNATNATLNGKADSLYKSALAAYNAYNSDISAQNTAVGTLDGLVQTFPADNYDDSNMATWEGNYQSALSALQNAATVTDGAYSSYQSALNDYNNYVTANNVTLDGSNPTLSNAAPTASDYAKTVAAWHDGDNNNGAYETWQDNEALQAAHAKETSLFNDLNNALKQLESDSQADKDTITNQLNSMNTALGALNDDASGSGMTQDDIDFLMNYPTKIADLLNGLQDARGTILNDGDAVRQAYLALQSYTTGTYNPLLIKTGNAVFAPTWLTDSTGLNNASATATNNGLFTNISGIFNYYGVTPVNYASLGKTPTLVAAV